MAGLGLGGVKTLGRGEHVERSSSPAAMREQGMARHSETAAPVEHDSPPRTPLTEHNTSVQPPASSGPLWPRGLLVSSLIEWKGDSQ